MIPASEDGESGVDLSTLRTFRVLRPLKLVSGVPSKQNTISFDRKYSAGNINSPIPRKSEIFYVKVLWKKKFRETNVSRAHNVEITEIYPHHEIFVKNICENEFP